MGAYASRCNWCGRSSGVSTFFQLVTLAGIIVAALGVVGVMPLSSLSIILPDSWVNDTPMLPQATETATGTGAPAPSGSSSRRSPGGYGSPATAAGRATDEKAQSRADREAADRRRGVVIGPAGAASDTATCASPPAVTALGLRYGSWSRADLELIACRRIRTGFTADQVTAALGRPRRQLESGDGSGTAVWIYRDRRVVLERGSVAVTGDR